MACSPTPEQRAAFNEAWWRAWPAWYARNKHLLPTWGPATDFNELRRADRERANENEPRVRMVDGVKVTDYVPSKAPPAAVPAPVLPDPWEQP